MNWSESASENPEIYTRTRAYNFLKSLLGISKKGPHISKALFEIFFRETYEGFFLKISEDEVKNLFKTHNIVFLNKQYYEANKSIPPEKRNFRGTDLYRLLNEEVRKITTVVNS